MRCARDNNDEYKSANITSTMQQVIIPDDNDGNACNWRQQRTFDQEKRQASPMSRGAKNSVQQDSTIINFSIINILPTRKKKQTNWEHRQNGPEDQNQPTTRRARAIAANLNNHQSRMTTPCENQFKESQRGSIEAVKCIEKSMSNKRKYQSIYHTAINGTTNDTNDQKYSICHTKSNEGNYYVTVGTDSMKFRQQNAECTQANNSSDVTAEARSLPYLSNTYYAVAEDMYDSIDIYFILSQESRGGNMQQSVVESSAPEEIMGNTVTAIYSRNSSTLTVEKTEKRQQSDQSSERSNPANPEKITAVQPRMIATILIKRAVEYSISNSNSATAYSISERNTSEQQEQSATEYNKAMKANAYNIMHHMPKSSYLLEQYISADGQRQLTSASERQEVTSPKRTKITTKQVQINSTANMLRGKIDSNHYLYERDTRITAEERTVVTKLNKLAANRPDESKFNLPVWRNIRIDHSYQSTKRV